MAARPTEPHPDIRTSALGAAVRARREALGLRQAVLAELAGCSARFVHTLERGKATLRFDKVLDVLEVLGLDLVILPGRGAVRATPLDRCRDGMAGHP